MLSSLRIGLMIPSANIVMEPEMYMAGIEGVTYHAMRLRLNPVGGAERLITMLDYAREGAEILMTAGVHAIVYGCTSGSFIKGPDFDKEVEGIIKEVTPDIPVVSTAAAVVEALRSLNVSRVSIGTPYTEDVTEKAKVFLEGNGFIVPKTMSLPPRNSTEKGDIPYRTTMDMAKAINIKDSEAIALLCTNLPTFGIIHRLENELGKPVVSSNQASLWAVLRRLGIYRPIERLGNLFL